jgi:hypothetical protein
LTHPEEPDMNTTLRLLPLALALVIPTRSAAAAPDWIWKDRLPTGQMVEVRNVNGAITAESASGSEVEVTVLKKARQGNPADLEIEVVKHAQGVTICAVYPTPAGSSPNQCRPGGGRMSVPSGFEVSASFTVKLPAGLRFQGHTVNGGINASSLGGDAELSTVNGSIDSSSSGQVRAKTVNGSVTARMGRTEWSGDLELQTVNGSVVVELPASASTEVTGSTVNGSIQSDFGLEVKGKWGPKKVSGTIGAGGRVLHLKSVNGSIQVRRRA